MITTRLGLLATLIAFFLLPGCASQSYLSNSGHRLFDTKKYDEAALAFGKEAAKPGTNQVLFLLDEGSSLFAAGHYAEATKIFLQAEDLCEIKDYTSISEEVGTLAVSSNVKGYKGEDFEKVLINVYLALSYAALGKVEDAQVEARKINNLLYRMITEGKRNYQESPFARYLSALMWESSGNTNDAYVDYKATFALDPGFPELGRDLTAGAAKLGFTDEAGKWAETFRGVSPRKLAPGEGELVVIFERGQSPVKVPRAEQQNLPRFVPRYSGVTGARVTVDGGHSVLAEEVLDIQGLSIRYLEDRIGRMKAAKLAGLAVKGAAAYGVGKLTNNQDLGMLAFYAMMAMDQADLRSWRSLPQSLEMVRIPLKAGVHQVRVEALNSLGAPESAKDFERVVIQPRKKVFLLSR